MRLNQFAHAVCSCLHSSSAFSPMTASPWAAAPPPDADDDAAAAAWAAPPLGCACDDTGFCGHNADHQCAMLAMPSSLASTSPVHFVAGSSSGQPFLCGTLGREILKGETASGWQGRTSEQILSRFLCCCTRSGRRGGHTHTFCAWLAISRRCLRLWQTESKRKRPHRIKEEMSKRVVRPQPVMNML